MDTGVCAHLLAIVNNAAMNMDMCKHLLENLLSCLWGIYPRVQFLGYMVILCLILLRKLHTIFHSAEPIYNPINSAQGFPFLHILTNTCYFLSF